MLVSVHFYTVADYLFLLQRIGQMLAPLGRSAMLYLAAAVSDFYLPESRLVSS
jgi:phosphopantothenate-cysteine ligase